MSNSIKFSIIMPVYNVADCLEKCLNSLLEQSYKNFEIICINDGSTDNSLDILKEFENKFENYKLIDQENKGLAETRNIGVSYAKGEYICYIDSDDFIEPDFFEQINLKTETSPDIIIFGAKTYYSKTEKFRSGQYSSKTFPKNFDINKLYSYHPVCWNKVYKRKFLETNNIKFEHFRLSEDQPFFIQVIILAKKIEIIYKDLYIYRKQRTTSITGNKKKNDFCSIEAFKPIKDFIEPLSIDKSLKLKILGRNVLKAVSRYPKCNEDIKAEYFEKITDLLNQLKAEPEKYWWSYFKLRENQSYFSIKLEYLKSFIFYFIKR